MKNIDKPCVILEGHLASIIPKYIKEIKELIIGEDFKHFEDETIMYALLEYASFDRKNERSSENRIEYIVRKCVEFQPKMYHYPKEPGDYKFEEVYDDEYPLNLYKFSFIEPAEPKKPSIWEILNSEENDDLPF